MKFLIVGFGSIGRRHFRNLRALGENDILFYRTANSTLDDEEIAGYPVEDDLDAALEHGPEGVIVANPTACHLDAAIPAAEKGCHILLEKPISHSMERVEDFKRIVENSGSRVLVGFQFRFHPNLIQIKEQLSQGVIGRPLSLRSHWGEYLPDWHPWEDYRSSYSARKDLGGGVLLTLCHPLDYLRWLFGEPKLISSQLGSYSDLELEVEDTAELSLLFGGSLIGSLHLNYTQIPPKHSLEIVGTEGSIYWDYYQSRALVNTKQLDGKYTTTSWSCPEDFDRNDLFLEEMRHFISVVNGGADPICTLSDGIAALKLAISAKGLGYHEKNNHFSS